MIRFIIYDESKENKELIYDEIDKEMMRYDIEYQKYYYCEFDKLLKEDKNNNLFKIYILNQTNISKSGLTVAKYIREKQDDWKSIIIFISNRNEYKLNIITKRLYILDYILIDKIKDELKKLIRISIKNYDSRPKELKYKYKYVNYNIQLKDIIYIEKEQDSKRCIIYTKNEEYYIQSTLSKLISNLDDRFIKSSKSYIINIEEVNSYNTKENIITLSNKKQIFEVSRNIKKELINKFRKV